MPTTVRCPPALPCCARRLVDGSEQRWLLSLLRSLAAKHFGVQLDALLGHLLLMEQEQEGGPPLAPGAGGGRELTPDHLRRCLFGDYVAEPDAEGEGTSKELCLHSTTSPKPPDHTSVLSIPHPYPPHTYGSALRWQPQYTQCAALSCQRTVPWNPQPPPAAPAPPSSPPAGVRPYLEVASPQAALSKLEEALLDHNSLATGGRRPLPLALFLYAVEHVTRIARWGGARARARALRGIRGDGVGWRMQCICCRC